MIKLNRLMRPLIISLALTSGFTTNSYALSTPEIVASTISPDCIDYRIVGLCYWLLCTPYGCSVKTSVKVRHYIPDAVVSSYANTGENPWKEVSFMSPILAESQAGNNGTTNEQHENNLAKFKNADVIGHPGAEVYNEYMEQFGYVCSGASDAFEPFFLSTFDFIGWRYNLPEMFYPEALMPGMREVGQQLLGNMWGNVYPRGGFVHQSDDYKAAAVVAQRAGDIVTRYGQPHIYTPMLKEPKPGYIPAGALIEGDISTGKWQELKPTMMNTCSVFPSANLNLEAMDGDFAWTLWRPYSCCQRKGQTFLGSIDYQ
ncbi:TIGR03756 family integrating conjugative element protein [Zophobihabitans entericus]|uniref:TIGR03756 family integrating conjugative element protein n=1 Tax=Zophobihabitans entericus TaxID=1635327 RepID=A0A6G9IC95_9GAMM|nr:TIGR03756 family integrating conjugative element protein [Zophobihabitans entericus]QIQ21452.1 TIGR03756 family integrating conjugative element protein [Zophobihabitans entericus]